MTILVYGTLLNPFNQPVANADITLVSITTSYVVLAGLPSVAKTDENGEYSLPVNPGSYSVNVAKGGYNYFYGAITVTATTPPTSLNTLLTQNAMEAEVTPAFETYFQQVQSQVSNDALTATTSKEQAVEAKTQAINAKNQAVEANNSAQQGAVTAQDGATAAQSALQATQAIADQIGLVSEAVDTVIEKAAAAQEAAIQAAESKESADSAAAASAASVGALTVALAATDGQKYIKLPTSITQLKNIASPINGMRITINGYASPNDNRGGEWYFDSTNQSDTVALYPLIYIAPTFDTTGASGAWRLNEGNNHIDATKYGVGSFVDNGPIVGQLVGYNSTIGKKIEWPRGKIYCTEINIVNNPKFYGVMAPALSSGGGSGTVFMFDNNDSGVNSSAKTATAVNGGSGYHIDDMIFLSNNVVVKVTALTSGVITSVRVLGVGSAPKSSIPSNPMSQVTTIGTGTGATFNIRWGKAPCITISGTSNSRITGLEIHDMSISSLDFATDGVTQTDRVPLSINYAGGQTSIKGLFVQGFKQQAIFNEIWDGEVQLRMLWCGQDGAQPAFWAGSLGADNLNAIKFYIHIEHCSWAYALDYCRHVTFIAEKIETGSAPTINNPAITVSTLCREVNHISPHFTTVAKNPGYFLQDYGNGSKYIGPWFTSIGAKTEDPYSGILWVDTSEGRSCEFYGATMHRLRLTTAIDSGGIYPIWLGDKNRWNGGEITFDSGSLSAGIFRLESNSFCDPIINAGTGSKAGVAYFCHGQNNNIIGRIPTDSIIGLLTSGSKQNLVENTKNGKAVIYVTGTGLFVEGVNLVRLNYPSPAIIDLFNAEQGQSFIVSLASGSANVTIKNNSSIILTGGANATMTAGQTMGFVCVDGINTCKQIY